MKRKAFGSLQLCECLIKLGFKPRKTHHSSHIKFDPPHEHKIPQGIRPFMIVQVNQKQFDPHECSRYISEIVQKGFQRDKVLKLLFEKS